MRRTRTRLALFLLATTLVARLASAQTSRANDSAREAYHRGQALFDAHRYSDALQAFRDSLARLDSPNTRLYIARSLREMDHPADAWIEFDRAARDAAVRSAHDSRYEATRVNALAERDALTPRIGLVRIVVDPGLSAASTIVNGRALDHDDLATAVPVSPGVVQVTLHTESGRDLTRVIDIAPGSTQEIRFAVDRPIVRARPAPSMRPLRVAGLTTSALGVLALAGGAIAGELDAAQYHQLQQACGAAPCPPSYADAISRGETEQLVANAFFVAGGVVLAAGAAMLLDDVLGHRSSVQTGAAVGPDRAEALVRIEF